MNVDHDALGAYVLDALPADETLAFRSHLVLCADCRAEEARLREAVAGMADDVAPSPALRTRVLEAVSDLPQEALGEAPVVQIGWRARVARIAAVAALFLVVAVGWAVTRPETADRVLASGDAVTVVLAGDVSGEAKVVISDEVGAAVLVAEGLPAPASGEFYELWVIDGDGPVSAGRFDVGDSTARFELGRVPVDGETLAITVEPGDGTDAPEGPVVLSVEV